MGNATASSVRFDWSKFGQRLGGSAIVLALLALISLAVYRIGWLTSVDSYELAYMYDLRTGRITRINHTGYVRSAPIVTDVHTIDLRPLRVCITANTRVLNCKLVQFNPAGLEVFLSWHGRDDYDASKLEGILMGYAYDGTGTAYPFLKVLSEFRTSGAPVADAGQ